MAGVANNIDLGAEYALWGKGPNVMNTIVQNSVLTYLSLIEVEFVSPLSKSTSIFRINRVDLVGCTFHNILQNKATIPFDTRKNFEEHIWVVVINPEEMIYL